MLHQGKFRISEPQKRYFTPSDRHFALFENGFTAVSSENSSNTICECTGKLFSLNEWTLFASWSQLYEVVLR